MTTKALINGWVFCHIHSDQLIFSHLAPLLITTASLGDVSQYASRIYTRCQGGGLVDSAIVNKGFSRSWNRLLEPKVSYSILGSSTTYSFTPSVSNCDVSLERATHKYTKSNLL